MINLNHKLYLEVTFVGLSIVPIIFNKVVFPPPLVPKMITNSFSFMSKVTPIKHKENE
jgi:hypothetical protein